MLKSGQVSRLESLFYLQPISDIRSSNYIYSIISPTTSHYPLDIGAPDSEHPVITKSGCRHCLPVLLYPAHCELQFHLRSFIPKDLTYCKRCNVFTKFEDKSFSDSKNFCGQCETGYWRRFERGRRMIDMRRPGEKQERLRKWYNADVQR
jgi:hypothetical protein